MAKRDQIEPILKTMLSDSFDWLAANADHLTGSTSTPDSVINDLTAFFDFRDPTGAKFEQLQASYRAHTAKKLAAQPSPAKPAQRSSAKPHRDSRSAKLMFFDVAPGSL